MSSKVFVIALLLSLGSGSVLAGDAAAGKEKAVTCVACHGEAGAAPISPQYPILAGQYEDYLSQALQQYQNGQRKNMIMTGLAAALSEQDIADLAAYFSSQSSGLRTIE
ncbi:MAG: cytochrome c [Gammaproteobacteria bacterium]|nr:cytochrome c [Gammaproteobacteria bacterium]NNF67735.1 cytochrome c [Gammaproteobacteria bacterium]